jgi:methyl-accepting chemotaxis protein
VVLAVRAERERAEAGAVCLAQAEQRGDAAFASAAQARERAEEARCSSLRGAAVTLGEAIGSIRGATDGLTKVIGEARSGAERQQRLVAEASTGMQQMNVAVEQVAGSAEAAANHAQSAAERAREGERAVAATIGAIGSVNERTRALAEVVAGLGEQAGAIGQIMGVINDIADQTNLLALNAAIEAARAGDAGRGFAVVADEVRKLAEKTMDATRQVGAQITSIQDGVAQTQQGMGEAESLVAEAEGRAKASGETLVAIVELVTENANQVQSIAAAATQQAAACEQVARNIATVDEISGRTTSEMDASTRSVADVLAQVDELQGLNGAFQLVGGGEVHEVIGRLAADADVVSMDPKRVEAALRREIKRSGFLELLYLTDARGIQPIGNIARPGSESPGDAKARGKDWSKRPWFRGPMDSRNMYVSDVYVSQASGRRCLTVSAPVWGGEDRIAGIIAADVTL